MDKLSRRVLGSLIKLTFSFCPRPAFAEKIFTVQNALVMIGARCDCKVDPITPSMASRWLREGIDGIHATDPENKKLQGSLLLAIDTTHTATLPLGEHPDQK